MDMSTARILVIDDRQDMRELLSEHLSSKGYAVDTASVGAEGIKKLEDGGYSLVLCDISMPGMDGIETLKYIKQYDDSIEVILITGHGSVKTAVESMKLGAYDYITKPFDLDELEIIISRALERREMQMLLSLHEVSKLFFSTVRFDRILEMTVKLAGEVLGAEEASVMLFDEQKRLYIAACSGLDTEIVRQTRLKLCEGIAGKIAAEKKPVILQDDLNNDHRFKGIESRGNIASSIVYPIISGEKTFGVLNIKRTSPGSRFSTRDMRKAGILVSHIGQALENANQYKEMETSVRKLELAHSELKNKQQHLILTEKMSALGNMTAGIAHEINNPLTVIIGFTEHLIKSGSMHDPIRQALVKIHDSAIRCRKIVKGLLSFSRVEGSEKRKVNLPVLINEVVEFVSHDLRLKGINLVLNISPELPPVNGNADMLRQVVLSMMSNAIDSIVDSGKEGLINISAQLSNGRIILRIEDSGTGIPEDIIDRIFDPFFTTKPVGLGSGLGLSACYGIINDHNGSITAESNNGNGAVFTVILPAVIFNAETVDKCTVLDEKKTSSVKNILVVDDEMLILDLCRTVLEDTGYKVNTVSSGTDALKQILTGEYDLIILDCRMPGMDGGEIFETVRSSQPDIAERIMFTSGDTTVIERIGREDVNERFLQKPFKVNELLDAVTRFENTRRITTLR